VSGDVRLGAGTDREDRYDQMERLADLFDATGDDLRARARLGAEVLRDPEVHESAELSHATWAQVEGDVRAATTGEHGLLTRGIELDADALMVRATVQTYRWIDELQAAAYQTLGAIAARAIGYLAPEVALGGAIVSAGLIETDALDRDGVTAYLNELAENNPELMHHVTSGGGGLLDGLQLRSLLTANVLAGDTGRLAAEGGLRAVGADDLAPDFGTALRDVAGDFVEAQRTVSVAGPVPSRPPEGIEALMVALAGSRHGIHVEHVGERRYIAYLPGPDAPGASDGSDGSEEPDGSDGQEGPRPRLVGGDHTAYAQQAVRAIEAVVSEGAETGEVARVMLVGYAQGGVTAAELASRVGSTAFVVDQVVTAGAPSAQVPRIPEHTRMLSLEDRSDPVALLGSLVNAGDPHRLTVVFDSGGVREDHVYVVGGRAADAAEHPTLREEIERLRAAGYLTG
jgi:hypothetical protein